MPMSSRENSVRDKILTAVERYDMLKDCRSVTVALSGGADSVALLHSLKTLQNELGIELSACHVNHNLRGEESDGDEAYVRRLCQELDVPLKVFSVDVSGSVAKHQSVEERARELRYEAFAEISERLGSKVATAHNACDNTETVLLNMLRGTGLKGLCGIPPVRDRLIRPLLLCTREEIEEYCGENGLKYVTDSTNASTAYTRNKIRLELVPKLLEINPSLHEGVGRMTFALSEDSRFLEDMARSAVEDARVSEGVYSAEKLSPLPDPILHRAISLMLREKDVEPTSLRITGFCEIFRSGAGKINIEKNKFAVVKKGAAEVQVITQNYRKKFT